VVTKNSGVVVTKTRYRLPRWSLPLGEFAIVAIHIRSNIRPKCATVPQMMIPFASEGERDDTRQTAAGCAHVGPKRDHEHTDGVPKTRCGESVTIRFTPEQVRRLAQAVWRSAASLPPSQRASALHDAEILAKLAPGMERRDAEGADGIVERDVEEFLSRRDAEGADGIVERDVEEFLSRRDAEGADGIVERDVEEFLSRVRDLISSVRPHERRHIPDGPLIVMLLTDLGINFCNGNRLTEAKEILLDAITIQECINHPMHHGLLPPLVALGMVFCRQRCFEKAEPTFLRALAIVGKTDAKIEEHRIVLVNLIHLYHQLNRLEDRDRMQNSLARLLRENPFLIKDRHSRPSE
jgi:hypothetical protein